MTGRVRRRRQARQDLIDIFRDLERAAGLDTARRFLKQAEATFRRLANMPNVGGSYEAEHPALADIRFFTISRFKNYVVFYRPAPRGIEIIRILHAARDIGGLLAREFGIDADEVVLRAAEYANKYGLWERGGGGRRYSSRIMWES